MAGQSCFRYPGSWCTVMPSTPGLPLLALTRRNACLQFSRSQTSSISCSVIAGLLVVHFAVNDSVPSRAALGDSLLLSAGKASTSWFFCRLSLVSRAAYSPLPLPSLRRTVQAFPTLVGTLPSADFSRPVRTDRSIRSRDFATSERSPEVSSTTFGAQPPNLHATPLDGCGLCRPLPARPAPHASNPVLVRRLALLLHASFRPRLAATPLRFANPSPPSGWVEDFHLRVIEHARHTKAGKKRPWKSLRDSHAL